MFWLNFIECSFVKFFSPCGTHCHDTKSYISIFHRRYNNIRYNSSSIFLKTYIWSSLTIKGCHLYGYTWFLGGLCAMKKLKISSNKNLEYLAFTFEKTEQIQLDKWNFEKYRNIDNDNLVAYLFGWIMNLWVFREHGASIITTFTNMLRRG